MPTPTADGATPGAAGGLRADGGEPEVVSLTRELVAIPSHEDPTEVGDRIADWLRANAPGVVLRDRHGNVFARRPPDGTPAEARSGSAADATQADDAIDSAGDVDPDEDEITSAGDVTPDGTQTLALVGHHDVVPPEDAQVAEDGTYAVRVEDGRIYGRGTADMKGAVAAAMLAFRDADPHPDRALAFASFVGEEVGGVGCRGAIADGFAPDWAVVAEGSTGYSAPGVTDVAVAHKGRRASTVTATGAAAHASVPEEGENAIYRATDAVDVLRDLDWPTVEVAGESLTGSVVVTEIEGGSAWNVVPTSCVVTVDERTVPGERAALDRVEDVPGVSWRVDQDLPPMRCTDDRFAGAVLDAASDAQRTGPDADSVDVGEPELVTKPHATDAGWLQDRAGTACVICGAAEPGEAHTATESASVAVLQRLVEIYLDVARRDFE